MNSINRDSIIIPAPHDSEKDLTPKGVILITYKDLFGKTTPPSFQDLLTDVPLIVALTDVLRNQTAIHFAMYAQELHRPLVDRLFEFLPKDSCTNLSRFLKRNPENVILYCTDATLHFCYEALRYCCDMDPDDTDLTPTREEIFNIVRAYTLCASEFVDSQVIDPNVRDTVLLLDLYESEFKFHKDFKSAVYKACRFFEFCEANPAYSQYLDAFCKDYKVTNWHQYIDFLHRLYLTSIHTFVMKTDESEADFTTFLDNFIIDREELRRQGDWNTGKPLLYLRDHFLVKFTHGFYYILSPDLIVDKFYQALKFMFFKTISAHGLMRPDGKKPFKDQPTFNQQLGNDFSETHLAYDIFAKTLKSTSDAFVTGADFKAGGLTDGEPDLYIRKGDSVALIEVKDLILGDHIKKSPDKDYVIEQILKRICQFPERPHKGFGQILDNIRRLTQGELTKFDPEARKARGIYPIIVTTDNAFTAAGVNSIVVEKAYEILSRPDCHFGERFISIPIILDIDTLINLSYHIASGKINFFQLLCQYINICRSGFVPFKVFIHEYYPECRGSSVSELEHLFGLTLS